MGNKGTIETLRVVSQSGKNNAECLGVKEEHCYDFVEVDNFIYPILHNQMNIGGIVLHNLLDCGNKYIEKLSVKEDIARNSLLAIESSIHEQVNLREEFNVLGEGKELHTVLLIFYRSNIQIYPKIQTVVLNIATGLKITTGIIKILCLFKHAQCRKRRTTTIDNQTYAYILIMTLKYRKYIKPIFVGNIGLREIILY